MVHVGIIGAGFVGRNHYNQYEQMRGRARVVALCDKEAQRRAEEAARARPDDPAAAWRARAAGWSASTVGRFAVMATWSSAST